MWRTHLCVPRRDSSRRLHQTTVAAPGFWQKLCKLGLSPLPLTSKFGHVLVGQDAFPRDGWLPSPYSARSTSSGRRSKIFQLATHPATLASSAIAATATTTEAPSKWYGTSIYFVTITRVNTFASNPPIN